MVHFFNFNVKLHDINESERNFKESTFFSFDVIGNQQKHQSLTGIARMRKEQHLTGFAQIRKQQSPSGLLEGKTVTLTWIARIENSNPY
jgi:hypothetical protein